MSKIIVVTGATGTGKTKLGVELAKNFNGEVISADSMQIYRGLDVITNTVTEEEADGIVHHCISYVDPKTQYNVNRFTVEALRIMDEILERNCVPIIVGGTAYYIEALLWDFTLAQKNKNIKESELSKDQLDILADESITEHEKLLKLDPESAKRIHPNNKRKLERSLEVFKTFGMPQSEILEKQHLDPSGIRGKLRWGSVLLFSLDADEGILDERLDKRVDMMVSIGLEKELELFCSEPLEGSGLLSQAIGYKEFSEYIDLKKRSLSEKEALDAALQKGLEKMKTVTRRYSRKQRRWVKNRLAIPDPSENVYFYPLDTSRPEHWDKEVSQPARDLCSAFLSGELVRETVKDVHRPDNKRTLLSCSSCNVICDCEISFKTHISSKRHKKRTASQRNLLSRPS